MSQHDYDIANDTFPNVRSDLNLALKALATASAGDTAPSTTYANMLWIDTANNQVKKRNEADDGWIILFTFNPSTGALTLGSPTLTTPTIDLSAIASAGDLPVSDGGTGASTASAARTNLGAASNAVQSQATWEAGSSTTESIVSPAKIAAAVAALAAGGGGFKSLQAFTSSGTWNRPSGITKVLVFVTGGGGGGGGASFNGNFGGGGGAGGTAVGLVDVSATSSATITVGAAGTAGAAAGGTGGAGGNSSWVGNGTLTGNGGGGGSGNIGGSTTSTNGGTASGGAVNSPGGDGELGAGDGGCGGASFWGGGGAGAHATGSAHQPGSAGQARGSGGGGGCTGSTGGTNRPGGAGVAGQVLVLEFE